MSANIEGLLRLRESGELTGLISEVTEIVFEKHPLTVGSIAKEYAARNPGTARARNEIAKRVSDAKALGLLKEQGSEVCPETGVEVALIVPCDTLPDRIERKRKTNAEKIAILSEALEVAIQGHEQVGDPLGLAAALRDVLRASQA